MCESLVKFGQLATLRSQFERLSQVDELQQTIDDVQKESDTKMKQLQDLLRFVCNSQQ